MARAQAMYRFDAAQPGDLSFAPGDMMTILEQSESGWWLGRTDDGRTGVFPYNRVKVIPNTPATAAAPVAPQRNPIPKPVQIVDRVNQVSCVPVEPIPDFGQQFAISVVLSSTKTVEGTRSMKDFRMFAKALSIISGDADEGIRGFDRTERIETEIPEWADNVKLSPEFAPWKTRERAEILAQYLKDSTGKPEQDYLLVYWMNPNAPFSMPEGEKRKVGDAFRKAQQAIMNGNTRPAADPILVRALYEWKKRDANDVSFQKGEVLSCDENSEYTGWWIGEKVNGDKGLFPYNYVTRLSPAESYAVLHPDMAPLEPMEPPTLKLDPTPVAIEKPFLPQPDLSALTFDNPLGLVGGGTIGASMQGNRFRNVVSGIFTKPEVNKDPRPRQKVQKYALSCTEAFDELLTTGVTIEENGKLARFNGVRDTPKKGDRVTLYYSGFIWEPQKQDLLEFASSDTLIAGTGANAQSGPLVFDIGGNQAIDGIEEAVQRMCLNQSVRVTLTPDKAYQDVGFPPDIPGNAYLVYDLTLKDIQRNNKGGATGAIAANGAMRNLVEKRPKDDNYNSFMGNRRQQSNRQLSQAQQVGVGPEHFKKKLTLAKVQEIVHKKQYTEYGIQPGLIEEYLTEEEFGKAFMMDHSVWLLMPAFKRKQLKESVGLF